MEDENELRFRVKIAPIETITTENGEEEGDSNAMTMQQVLNPAFRALYCRNLNPEDPPSWILRAFFYLRNTVFIIGSTHVFITISYSQVSASNRSKEAVLIVFNAFIGVFCHAMVLLGRRNMSSVVDSLENLRLQVPSQLDPSYIRKYQLVFLSIQQVFAIVITTIYVWAIVTDDMWLDLTYKLLTTNAGNAVKVDTQSFWPKFLVAIVGMYWFLVALFVPYTFAMFVASTAFSIKYIAASYAKKLAKSRDLKELLDIHNNLTDTIRRIDKILSFKILVIYSHILMQVLRDSFNIIFSGMRGNYMYYMLLEIMAGIMIIFIIILPAALVPDTKKLILKQAYLLPQEFYQTTDSVSLIMKIQNANVALTFWDMMDITKENILSTLGAITTYVLVLGTTGRNIPEQLSNDKTD